MPTGQIAIASNSNCLKENNYNMFRLQENLILLEKTSSPAYNLKQLHTASRKYYILAEILSNHRGILFHMLQQKRKMYAYGLMVYTVQYLTTSQVKLSLTMIMFLPPFIYMVCFFPVVYIYILDCPISFLAQAQFMSSSLSTQRGSLFSGISKKTFNICRSDGTMIYCSRELSAS